MLRNQSRLFAKANAPCLSDFNSRSEFQYAAAREMPVTMRGQFVHFRFAFPQLCQLTCYVLRMKILVTGAAGFIGSVTAELLLEQGHSVVALDNLSSGHRENVPTAAQFVEGDCGDVDLVSALEGIDACMHFASLIETSESMHFPEKYFSNNVASTFRLTQALISSHVDKFVFSSSCAVYGEIVGRVSEKHTKVPVSPYGQCKLMVEQGLEWLANQGRLRSACFRYFNAAGAIPNHAERHDPETHLIPLALATANGDREVLKIYGSDYATVDGTCVRDYVHVRDLAQAHVLAMEALDKRQYLTLNLGSGIGFTNRQVIEMVEKVTNRSVGTSIVDRREGDQASTIADISEALNILNWEPSNSSLEKMIEDAWVGYREIRV